MNQSLQLFHANLPAARSRVAFYVLQVAVVSVLASSLAAQIDDDEFRPGLIAEYSNAAGQRCVRVDRAISFDWGRRPPDARLGAGPFSARWTGYLMSQLPGEYRLYVYAAGKVSIRLGGKPLLDAASEKPGWLEARPIEIPFDWHELEITYQSQAAGSQLALFWSGPQFQLEPVDARLFHDTDKTPGDEFQRGGMLVQALRCAACHEIPGQLPAAKAPALDRLAGNLSRAWLVDWLSGKPAAEASAEAMLTRRMPHFDLTPHEAEAVAEFLFSSSAKASSKRPKPAVGNVAEGEHLLLTTGCLACHKMGELGESGLFGGGELSQIAEKRPVDFFARWLSDPAKINRNHRMPVFELSSKERGHLAAFLTTLRSDNNKNSQVDPAGLSDELADEGKRLVAQYRCLKCHDAGKQAMQSAPLKLPTKARSLSDTSDFAAACLLAPEKQLQRPGYRLSPTDRKAVEQYIQSVSKVQRPAEPEADGAYILAERNCLACHARGASLGLAPKLTAVSAKHDDLAPLVPAMTPPALISVGDKLHNGALTDAIRRTKGTYRPWLSVRMPKFDLSDDESAALVQHFIQSDRIPDRPRETVKRPEPAVLDLAGARLVTTDGFGCTSCHQVGGIIPPKAPLNARGPNLSLLEQRIRRTWYDRWVRNPARIVPRMEMPSVQLAVRGVLDERLDDQLAAVWQVLNKPDFEPPEPNPVRVVRRSGIAERGERAAVLTDVLNVGKQTFIKPLLVGLPNRHNVLVDLESNRLAGWWMGDAARQRTKGKTWFWEAAGDPLLGSDKSGFGAALSDIYLTSGDGDRYPQLVGQFPTEFDELWHTGGGVAYRHRLRFADGIQLQVTQSITPRPAQADGKPTGFRRHVEIAGAPSGQTVKLRLAAESALAVDRSGRTANRAAARGIAVRLIEPATRIKTDAASLVVAQDSTGPDQPLVWTIDYTSNLPVDRFPIEIPPIDPPPPQPLQVVPGYEAVRLPLADEFMPTGLAWRPDGTLIVTSLKGRVWLGRDTDGDGLEDRLTPFSDELAAPFGAAAAGNAIDVINKYALLRLIDEDGDGRADRMQTLASGWGHTTDYHDWAVGLPRDAHGNYYLGIPCQQDQRTPASAHLRGSVLRLAPRTTSPDDPRLFEVEPLTGGHRFPIGIALNRHGALFVSDNQGNYNPFNELNHVIKGSRYGFINALERRRPDFKPPLTPPAIDIPHPWTRSVNGICFLDTPPALRQKLGRDLFGPFEGHLIGCEYDTRRLVRLSLERVGDTYQGAAYPFSFEQPAEGEPLLGPLTCAVAPDGDLYVGSLRDSGWGGANNVGALARLRPSDGGLPAGIAEVRAVGDGFLIAFTRPVDAKLAADAQNYSLASYTRVSTPAYGGPDVDRRIEKIAGVEIADDRLSAKLRLTELREGFVYEIRVKNLTAAKLFFPAEAHYTLRR